MYTQRAFMSVWPVLGAAIVACAFFAGNVAAKDVKVAFQVSTQGLDLKQPAGGASPMPAFSMLRRSSARMVTASTCSPPQTRKVAMRRRSAMNSLRQSAAAHAGLSGNPFASGSCGARDRGAGADGGEVRTAVGRRCAIHAESGKTVSSRFPSSWGRSPHSSSGAAPRRS